MPVELRVPETVIVVASLAVIGNHTPVAGTPEAKLNAYWPTRTLAVQVPELLVNTVPLVLVPVISDDC